MNYIRSLREVYNKTVHGIQLVPFVGHDDFRMFKSSNGRKSIFGVYIVALNFDYRYCPCVD